MASILLERGLATTESIVAAERNAAVSGIGLGTALVRAGALSEDQLIATLSDVIGTAVLAPQDAPDADRVLHAAQALGISTGWLVDNHVIVWADARASNDNAFLVAGPDIYAPRLQEEISRWPAGSLTCQLATSVQIEPILLSFRSDAQADDYADPNDPRRLAAIALDAPVVDFVNAVLAEAAMRRASDVHIEPFEDKVVVRMRIDGVLSQRRMAPTAMFDAISSRIKLLSGMDIAERRLPQDGRQSLRLGGRDIDVRVSALPTEWGESIVIRLLGKSGQIPALDALGLEPTQKAVLLDTIARPQGLVLVSGPTGSGKTTTVYRLLSHLNDGVKKIITIEDPVEFHLPGMLQTGARTDIGLDFARGLRSILRQDPDVIFVGEIRDPETARTAVQAALTGHLVISTVHTNSALSAVSRMVDLGVEPYLLADVMRCVVGQRLLRKNCPSCTSPASNPSDLDARLAAASPQTRFAGPPAWAEGKGCETCSHTGFLGRMGVYETVAIDARMMSRIRSSAEAPELTALARQAGHASLPQMALSRARAGQTTLQEALRVVDMGDE